MGPGHLPGPVGQLEICGGQRRDFGEDGVVRAEGEHAVGLVSAPGVEEILHLLLGPSTSGELVVIIGLFVGRGGRRAGARGLCLCLRRGLESILRFFAGLFSLRETSMSCGVVVRIG